VPLNWSIQILLGLQYNVILFREMSHMHHRYLTVDIHVDVFFLKKRQKLCAVIH
jgi:hypothetical protein